MLCKATTYNEHSYKGGATPLTKNWYVLCSISKLSTSFLKIAKASYSKLSEEVKNSIKI